MEFEALRIIGAPLKLAKRANIFCHRNLHYTEAFCFMAVLLATIFTLGMNEPCSMALLRNQLEYDACRAYRDESSKHLLGGDVTSGPAPQGLLSHGSLTNVCPDANSFCFRSTLPGFLSPEADAKSIPLEVSGVHSDAALPARTYQVRTNGSWSSCCGVFRFSSGRTLSCSLYDQENCHKLPYYDIESEKGNEVSSCTQDLLGHKIQHFPLKDDGAIKKSGILDDTSTHVEISPPLLDWGHKNLYTPSLAFLTVRNTHNDDILTVFEPYSCNSQFYPCNFSEILLAPGEVASICIVFLPTLLGLSLAQLVLQTSFGGFLIQATGFGLESPYGIPPLIGLDVSSSGKWRKNLSLFNPFSEALYVEEVTARISISSGNTSQSTKEVCSISSIKDEGGFPTVMEWIDVKTGEVGLPLISMRPHRNWEVGPQKTETIMELDFSFRTKAKVFGAFCMQLLKSSKEKVDTIMVPLEAELGGRSASDEHISPILVSLKPIVPCDTSGGAVVLSLRNEAPYLLSVLKISEMGESSKRFHIKYLKGLMLFPGTVTQVALVSYTPASQMHDSSPESVAMNISCGLVILTNDSRNSQVEISCWDVISVCSRGTLDSTAEYVQVSKEVEYGNTRKKSSGSAIQPLLLNEALNTAEIDELVLKSWKSHATASGMSVLDDHELLFPVVGVGSHSSKLITIKNPSQQPVVMQLILNSGEIIDECKAADDLFQASFSSSLIGNSSVSPVRYGFSIAEGALTEAFVHPYGTASLGPIFFQPANRCVWKSSALIRNNLSGVEWLSLRGYGGSLSLVLFEDSEPVHHLDFRSSFPTPHTFSSPDLLYHVEDNIDACSQPLSKDLYAKNMGDLPLEVKRIEVSGTECGLGGFVVQACKGFTLEPGESIKLRITYQTDFSAATMQRDLELALATGILVIPMKASLPMYMLSFCKKSLFWMRVKKSFVTILLVASLLFLVFCCFLPYVMAFVSQEYFVRSGRSFSLRGDGTSAHQNEKNCKKFSLSGKMNGLLRSIGEEGSLLPGSLIRYADGQTVVDEQISTVKLVKSTPGHEKQTNRLLDFEKETTLSSSSTVNSMAVKSHDMQETTLAGNLKVKTGKDKGRRRRKKRSSGSGLSGLFEVSSSQSGNSTPSSPLSPASSLTPQRSVRLSPDLDQSGLARNPFATVASQQCERKLYSEPTLKSNTLQPEIPSKPSDERNCPCGMSSQDKSAVLLKMDVKPILLPSATLRCPDRPDLLLSGRHAFLASLSKIAPYARAPGSKLHDEKAIKAAGKLEVEEKFTYDIWGDHIFALPSTYGSKEVAGVQPHVTENDSYSFFVRGPQALMTIAQSKSVSFPDQMG